MRNIVLLFFLLPLSAAAQWLHHVNIDSLNSIVNASASDTAKVNRYRDIYNDYLWKHQQTSTFLFLRDGLKLARKCGFRRGEAEIYKCMTGFCLNVGNLDYAKKYDLEGLAIWEELGDSVAIVSCHSMLGRIYSGGMKSDSALNSYLIAMRYNERHRSNDNAWKDRIARNYAVVGREYTYKRNDSLAIYYLGKSLQYRMEINYYDGVVASSNFLRDAYDSTGNVEKAVGVVRTFLWFARKQKADYDMSTCFGHLARYSMNAGKDDSAKIFLDSALYFGTRTERTDSHAWLYKIAADLYSKTGDTAKAFLYLREYLGHSENKLIADRLGASGYMQSLHEMEANENRISLQESELSRQRTFLVAVGVALLALFAVSFLIYRGYRNKQRANKALAEKNLIIESFNKDITDSIQYAQKIQEAVFPPRELKHRLFPEAFVLYQPRDIVSGDFYWFEEKNGKRFIAAADCTGHGVPGAFMSMLGNAFLNQVVKDENVSDPAEVLNKLRNKIISAMKQQDESRNKDGMDIALLVFGAEGKTVEYAGANNPLWIARKKNDQPELIAVKADKQPVGLSSGELKSFTCHRIEPETGDMMYIFSDGYADQFGGDENKKFMSKRFRELLLSICHLPPSEQEDVLLREHEKWKGNLSQVDDILVIGIRIR